MPNHASTAIQALLLCTISCGAAETPLDRWGQSLPKETALCLRIQDVPTLLASYETSALAEFLRDPKVTKYTAAVNPLIDSYGKVTESVLGVTVTEFTSAIPAGAMFGYFVEEAECQMVGFYDVTTGADEFRQLWRKRLPYLEKRFPDSESTQELVDGHEVEVVRERAAPHLWLSYLCIADGVAIVGAGQRGLELALGNAPNTNRARTSRCMDQISTGRDAPHDVRLAINLKLMATIPHKQPDRSVPYPQKLQAFLGSAVSGTGVECLGIGFDINDEEFRYDLDVVLAMEAEKRNVFAPFWHGAKKPADFPSWVPDEFASGSISGFNLARVYGEVVGAMRTKSPALLERLDRWEQAAGVKVQEDLLDTIGESVVHLSGNGETFVISLKDELRFRAAFKGALNNISSGFSWFDVEDYGPYTLSNLKAAYIIDGVGIDSVSYVFIPGYFLLNIGSPADLKALLDGLQKSPEDSFIGSAYISDVMELLPPGYSSIGAGYYGPVVRQVGELTIAVAAQLRASASGKKFNPLSALGTEYDIPLDEYFEEGAFATYLEEDGLRFRYVQLEAY